MSEAVIDRDEAGQATRAQLTIHKGVDGELDLGGLHFVACRREIERVDGGVTLIVRGQVEGAERDLLRFDFFRKRPHFHVPAENASETAIDGERFGDGVDWGLEQVTTGMTTLLERAGFPQLAASVDSEALADSRSALRQLVEGLAEPSETSYFEVDASVLAGLTAGD